METPVTDITAELAALPKRIQDLIGPMTSCWVWKGYKDKDGYGQIWYSGGSKKAHRVCYELLRGKIGDGLTIDHLCRCRACVNPSHMEAVPIGVNTLRGDTVIARQARQTHCKRGHEFTAENTYVQPSKKGRICRECRRAYWVNRRNSSKEQP